MIKTTYSTMLLVIGFLAVMLMLPSAHLNAGAIDNPNDSPAYSISNVNQTDIKGLNQSESPLLMAQTTEENRSSDELFEFHGRGAPPVQEHAFLGKFLELHEDHTTEAPPAGENGSSASSSSSMKTITSRGAAGGGGASLRRSLS